MLKEKKEIIELLSSLFYYSVNIYNLFPFVCFLQLLKKMIPVQNVMNSYYHRPLLATKVLQIIDNYFYRICYSSSSSHHKSFHPLGTCLTCHCLNISSNILLSSRWQRKSTKIIHSHTFKLLLHDQPQQELSSSKSKVSKTK